MRYVDEGGKVAVASGGTVLHRRTRGRERREGIVHHFRVSASHDVERLLLYAFCRVFCRLKIVYLGRPDKLISLGSLSVLVRSRAGRFPCDR